MHSIGLFWLTSLPAILSGYRLACLDLYDCTGSFCRQAGTMVVWQCLSAGKSLRQVAGEIFTAPADSEIRSDLWFPAFHGDVHLYDVRRADVFCMGRLERYGPCLLDHHSCHDHRRSHFVVHLCAAHLVFILPDGNAFLVGFA